MLALEAGPLRKISWAFLVVDEAHRLKNENSRLAQIARSMSAAHRVLLTGTPIQNNLHELWALLNFLYPKIFTSSEPFDQGFDAQSGKVQEDVVQRLHRLLQGCLLRRLKTEVEKSMPPKKETKLFLPRLPHAETAALRAPQLATPCSRPGLALVDWWRWAALCTLERRPRLSAWPRSAPEARTPASAKIAHSEAFDGRLVPMQAQWYRKVLMRDLQTLSDGRGGKGSTHAQNIVMHLRKVCNHPYLFEGAEPGPPFIDGEHMVENCGKMVVLDKLLKRLLPGGHRVLIFVTMTRMLDIIEDYCNLRKYEHRRAVHRRPWQCASSAAAPPRGAPGGPGRPWAAHAHTLPGREAGPTGRPATVPPVLAPAATEVADPAAFGPSRYCRLDGSTSTNDREAMMEEFNRPGSPKGIFMLSTRAGGLGINLFTADTVILYDSDWNPQQDLQAQDRAHRIGQTRPVNVYRFCMESTIEEKIIERAERKLFLDRMVVEQGRLTVQMPSAKGDELMSMIKFGADAVLKSNGASLTDADIDVLLTQGEARTAEMAAKLKTDCQMSLDNYNTQLEGGGSDLTKLYELDGVEYDAKGVRELIAQLRASEEAKRGKGDADGNGGDGSSVSSTLERMLTQQWNVLRNVRVCDEPGAHKREGQTIHDSVSRRLAAIARESAEAKEQGRPENSDNATEGAWYTIDKKEVQDRHWELVATILLQFGFEDISADSPQQRCMKIPLQLCTEFAERVVAPWQSAWRAFRASQRGNRGSEGGGGGAGTGTGTGTAAASSAGADTAAATALGLSEAASAGPPPGDSIFAWGCLDWVTTMTRAGDKKNERSAFIVSVPALVDQMPSALNGKQIRQLASGGRHIALCTEDGEVYAWGRGVAGCLGVGATGCAGHPMPVRSLALGKVKITSLSCGAEHTCLISDAGALYSCGAGKRGQLGLGHTDNSALPQRVAGVRGGSATRCAASVSCGGYHTAVLLKDGSLFTCGAHDNGVLGHALAGGGGEWEDTRLTDCTTLGQVHTLSANTAPVSVVSAGGLHNLALTSKGLYGWGAGSWGRLGMGGDNKDKNVPTFIKAAAHLGGLCGVAAGWEHSLLLTVDGSVFQFGRLGHSYMNLPQQVQGLGPNSGTPIESISAGRGYSLAVDTSGELWVWGAIGPSGALGLGEKDGNKVKNARTVTQIETLAGRRITQVAAGHVHMVVLADSGRSTASDMAVASEDRFGSASQQVEEHSVCDVCKEGDEDGDLIFCDWCNKGYHAECHDPKLTNIPEGDWICFNCKLERFSSCNVCGMQDELSATLALCETDDCPHHGCVHIECLLAEERPPLKQDAKEADANDDADAEVDGGALDDSGRAEEGQAAAAEQRKEVVKKKPPAAPFGREAKKAWDISSFSWFCSKCCDEKGVAATKGSEHAAGGTHPAPAGKELTPAHRKLLKQYFELCKQPDQAELRLLASLTERGPVETKAWFEQKVAQEEAAARRAERERREKEQALKLQAEGGNGGASYTTPEMFSRQEQLKNQGNTSFAMKDYDAALRHYASAINIDPRDSGPQAHVLHYLLLPTYY